MAAYAGALFIRSEAEIKRPVVLLNGARRCTHACGVHAAAACMCMLAAFMAWLDSLILAAMQCTHVHACCIHGMAGQLDSSLQSASHPSLPRHPSPPAAGERTNVYGVLEKHFCETALPPSERFWRAVRGSCWPPAAEIWLRVTALQGHDVPCKGSAA